MKAIIIFLLVVTLGLVIYLGWVENDHRKEISALTPNTADKLIKTDEINSAYVNEKEVSRVIYRAIKTDAGEIIEENTIYRNIGLDNDGLQLLQKAIDHANGATESSTAVPTN